MVQVSHRDFENDVFIVMPEKPKGNVKHALTTDESAILKSVSPLTKSMLIFGLFFLKDKQNNDNIKIRWPLPKFSSMSHAYAFAVLMAMWINLIRLTTIFTPDDKPGCNLIWKLVVFAWHVMCVLVRTSGYRACSTGKMLSLFRVFGKKLNPECLESVRRKALLYAILAWTFVGIWLVSATYISFSSESHAVEIALAPFSTYFSPDPVILPVLKCMYLIPYFYAAGAAQFPMMLDVVIAEIFSLQFTSCNRKFREAIDNSVSLKESFEDLRRQHQTLSRLVSKADKFICLSNTAYVSGLIFLVIATLYNFIWNPMLLDSPIFLFFCIVWMLAGICGLSIVSYGSISVNHTAHKIYERIHDIDLTNLSSETIGQVNTFLNRLCGEPIGFTVLRIFVIDRNTILTILGLLITYFLLIVQLVPPSSVIEEHRAPTQNGTSSSSIINNFTTSFF